jgi:hypothetical protein
MGSFLFYWQTFYSGAERLLFKLNQNSHTMTAVRPGDVVWAFIRRQPDNRYVLVARFLVSRVGKNDDHHPDRNAGQWFFESDEVTYLDPQKQNDAEATIRNLDIPVNAEVLGGSFQGGSGVREITQQARETLDRQARLQPRG